MIATIAFGLFILAAAVQVFYLLRRQRAPVTASGAYPAPGNPRTGAVRRTDPVSHYLLLAAALLLIAVIVERSVRIRFVAVTNTFESLVFWSGTIGLLLFLYRLRAGGKVLPLVQFGGTMVSIALLAVASSPIAPREVLPPIPALQSHWLVLHVTFSFIGEAFFVVAFVSALVYLFTRNEERRADLDRLTYTSVAIGYPIFTAGALIFGAIWAEVAWGRYWSWDPKETWALITWLTYTAYLHTRFVRRLRGTPSAVLSIVGFAFTLFTFFGVNFLLSGLHSYR